MGASAVAASMVVVTSVVATSSSLQHHRHVNAVELTELLNRPPMFMNEVDRSNFMWKNEQYFQARLSAPTRPPVDAATVSGWADVGIAALVLCFAVVLGSIFARVYRWRKNAR